ncbi:MAG: baseplate J/gp47 family protein [Lachnospiraceae bacterium]|nr:baseplate J/gp47 family protein [Lachnospiraceae bacterium]
MTSYEEILQGMLALVPSNVDKREGSIIYDALAPCAFFLAEQNFRMENFADLVLPDTAVDAYLDRAVSAYGVTRKAASAAVRKVTTTGEVAIGSRWAINDLIYVVIERLEDLSYAAECETEGEIGNQYSGPLQALSNTTGISAELADIITPGTDTEADEALRERFYQKVRNPATSGNAYHYKQWALEVPGVGDAKVFPLDNGPGTVTVLIVDSDKQADETLEEAVAEHIETVRPIGASVTIDSPEVTAVNVSADILLDGSRTMDEVLSGFKKSLVEYISSLVFVDYRVSYAKVGSVLLGTNGVKDYDNLRLNDLSGNVVIDQKAIPTMGIVSLSEVSAFGVD